MSRCLGGMSGICGHFAKVARPAPLTTGTLKFAFVIAVNVDAINMILCPHNIYAYTRMSHLSVHRSALCDIAARRNDAANTVT